MTCLVFLTLNLLLAAQENFDIAFGFVQYQIFPSQFGHGHLPQHNIPYVSSKHLKENPYSLTSSSRSHFKIGLCDFIVFFKKLFVT